MEQIKGIYAAGLSVLDQNLALDVKNTIKHAENVIDLGCHGVVFFGSTGQSQLISLSEKIQLINELPNSRYKNKFIIGTGLNSLIDTINLMKISRSMGFNNFLIIELTSSRGLSPILLIILSRTFITSGSRSELEEFFSSII